MEKGKGRKNKEVGAQMRLVEERLNFDGPSVSTSFTP